MTNPIAEADKFHSNTAWYERPVYVFLLFLPAVILRFTAPLHFPYIHIDEASWSLGPKNTLNFGNPTAYGVTHIFLSPWHYLSTLFLYKLFYPSLAISRTYNSLMGLGVIIFIWALGKRFFGQRVGVLAALLCAYSSLMIVSSRRALLDQEVTFYLIAASFFWLHPNRKLNWISGLFLGAGLLVKANALALIPALLLNQFFTTDSNGEKSNRLWKRIPGRYWWSIMLAVSLAIIVYTAFWWYDPHDFTITWQKHSVNRWGSNNPFVFVREFAQYIPDMLLLSAIGAIMALKRFKPPLIFLVSWPIINFILITSQSFRPTRYYYPIVPAMALLAAFALDRIFFQSPQQQTRRRWSYTVMILCLLIDLERFSVFVRRGYATNKPMLQTTEWIKQNVPRNEPVLGAFDYIAAVNGSTIPEKLYFKTMTAANADSAPGLPRPQYVIWINSDRLSSIKLEELDYIKKHYYEVNTNGEVVMYKLNANLRP